MIQSLHSELASANAGCDREIVFLFPGQGSQYPDMGQQMFETHKVFRQAITNCAEILRDILDVPLLELLYPSLYSPNHPSERIHETSYAQPALFAVEYAVVELWKSLGVVPTAVLGHSLGEYVAACTAGVFSLEDGLKLVARRGQLMQSLPKLGSMVAVTADEMTVEQRLAGISGVAIAAYNGPDRLTISGEKGAIAAAIAQLQQADIRTKPLRTSHAYHSPLIEPILADWEQMAKTIRYSTPHLQFFSSLTGSALSSEVATSTYWVEQTRQPVRFHQGLNALIENGYRLFIEAGPAPVLTRLGQRLQSAQSSKCLWLPSLHREKEDYQTLLSSFGQLFSYASSPSTFSSGTAMQPSLSLSSSSSRKSQILQILQKYVSQSLGHPAPVDPEASLIELGADSINLIETVQTLEQIFDIQVSMHQLFEELTTLNSIAEHLDQTLADDWLLPEIFQSYPAVTEVTTDKLTTGKAATGKAAAEATEPSVDKGANDKDTKLPAFQGAKPSSKTAVPLSADTKLHSPTQPLSPSHTTPRLAHIMQQQLSVMQSVMQQQLTVLRRCAQNTTPSRQNGNRPNKLNRKPMNGYSNGYSSDSAVGYSNGNDNGQKKARKVVDKAAEKAIENFQQKLIDIDWSESIDFQPSRRSATDVPRLVKTKQIEPRTDISKTTFPLSSAQQRLWFLDRFEGASATYNLPFALRLSGELDIAALRQCLNKIVERHEALRTRFVEAAGQGMQVVQPPFILEMPVEAIASEQALTHCLQIEAQIPFDLEAGPLLRAKLLQTAPNQHILLLTLHHIIADGWSMGLIVREVMALYKDGDRSALPELPIQYADYSVWQQQQQQSEDFKARLESWVSQLSDAPPLLKLPTDFPRPAVQSFRGGVVRKKASAELSEQLKTFSRQRGTTLFNTLITAFSVLMYRYSKQSDMAVATPIAGREHPDVKNLIGFFINTLPLRLQLAEDDSFETLLKRVQGVNLKAFDNRDIPFTQLIEALPLERDPSYLPLCQVMFVLQNAPQAKFELPDLTLESLSTHAGIAQYDLTLSTFVEEDGLVCEWEYNSDLFAVETVEKMAAHFEHLLGQVTQNTGDSVARLPLLASAEQQQILELASCHTRVSEPLRPVHEWFETQVEQSPDAVALIKIASLKTERLKTERLETESWSYRQLNERANQIARHLQGAGVGANQIVAVCVERSYPQIAALLAVLKLGAAYLPMDPTYPAERLHLMLEETQATALITQAHIQTQHGLQNTNIVDVDDKNIAAYSTENLGQAVALDDRAYLIFTSGSTGRPKGTELIHRGLANFVQQSSQQYKLGSDERVLQFASISFDAAAEEIYLALCSGNALILRDDEMISSSETFCRVSAEQQLTVWDLPTAFWHRLTQDIAQGLAALPESLRLVIIGGEKVQPQTVQQWQQIAHGRGIRLLNTYGPTEATVVAAFYEVASDWQYTSGVEVPIGRPLGNVEAYVLDRYLQLVPLGVEGELYIGGSGLAAGYLNRPELTAERFIENPFEPGDRIYKTGDLVRMSATGDLIYLGRTDSQVKIRGFRVELGEIESAIGQLDAVREVAVIVREDVPGKQTLCGYVVPRSDESIDAIALKKELRKELRQRLPEYMVPTYIVQMDALPLTGNNKVDRKALPVPQSEDLATESQYQAPRNQTEAELVAIWERLLEASPIGIEDSFFELGGHSLLAMQLVSRIQQQFQVQLSLASLFQNPTIAAIAKQIADSQASENFLALADIPIADRTQPIPLSSAQQRLWFLDRFEGASATYNMPFALRLAGELDVAALKQCLNEIVERHEALRTRFADVAGQGVQIVQPPFSLEIPVEVVSEEVLTHRLQAEAQMPFDLETELLLRAKLLQVEPTQHVLLLTLHHIIADGWSMGLIVREVMALYKDGDRSALPELPIQYADYAVWQQQQQQSEDYQARLESWVSQLADAPALLKLPTDFPRPAAQTFNGEIVRRTTSAQLSQQLQRFSQRHGTTLFTTLMSAFATLMHRYSQQSDLVIATPIAGRSHPDLEHLIGFFVNTLPLRIQLSEGDSFETLLDQVHAVSLNAFNNQDIPFAQLVEALPLKRDPSYLPLCQVMFALQNAPQTKFERPDLTLENLVTHAGIAQYDLTLSASIEENGLVCEWEYNSDLFAEETVERIAAHFEHLLRQIVQNASDSVDCLSLLEKDQQQQLLSLAECPDQVNKPLRPVHEWFEARVEQSPDAIVLVGRESSETESWSYRQLNERANQIARRLQATGVESNQVVAVCIERSNNLIAALLAVLKLGAAYLPMDPSYPSERLCLMLEEAQATALITRQYIQTQHGLQAANTIDIADERIAAYPTTNLGQTVGLDERAYIIFTSGSTGKPKGTELTHRGLANFVQQSRVQYGFGSDERVLQFASISFDAAVEEIYLTLCGGGTLVLRDDEMIASSEAFCRVSAQQQLTVWDLPTAFWHRLTKDIAQGLATLPDSLRTVIIGGEKVQAQIVQQWQQIDKGRNVRLLNTYGPTEATVVATFYEVASDWQYTPGVDVPIGRPLGNVEAYVLDRHRQLAPLGVAGELYLGGLGLAMGYLNQPELSAERFIAHPFKLGDRLYRTGDLVRMIADGDLHYMGRADDQVKIRGFRVELGEIESAIGQLDVVREVAVICREDTPGKQTLCAYVVPRADESFDAIALKKELRKELPEYMVPTYIVQMDSLPLTGNNKVDRKALPVPQSEDLATETRYQAPRNQTEAELVAIWESLLEVSSIGIEDSFFELGGHSLLAMQLVSRIQQQFQVQLSLASLFQNPTIAATAKQIANSQASGSFLALVDIPVAERTQPLPITVAQQRIWLLEQMEDMDGAYNMAACQRVRGELDVAVLDRCLAFLASRHESLRTTFHLVDEQPVQLIHESLPCKVDYAVMEELDDVTESVIAFMSQPFDLTTGPLLRVKLIQTAPREQILMVSIHHIISDGWSLGLLTQEMMSIYPALAQGQTPLLPELPIQVADFARWQRELLQGEYLQTQLDYWRQQLGDAPARLELPSDRPRLSEQTFAGSTLSAVLPTELSAKINRFSQQSGVSLYMTLLAAFGILLHRYSAQEEVFIGSPIANRNHPQVQGLIGLFLNTLVLRLDCGNNPRFTDFIQQIKETAIGAYAHQDTPFEQLLEILPSDRQQNTSPWFQVMFILQNNKEIQFSLPGVELEPINLDMGVAKFDLTLSVEETHDGLLGKWEYNCDLFDKDTIERMAACFEHLLAQLVEDAEQPIDAVPLLSAGEQQRMHSLSVQESVTAEPLRPVHEWFEQQAKEKPEAIALTARNTSWRYAQLNQQANQIARHLQSVGVSENYIVALCLERSPELIAALLAVLKVGAAYLPMDPTYPAERLHQMVEDAQVAALVTREEIQSQLNFGVAQVIDVDDAAIQNQSIDDLDLTISLEQRAYVIFTSGSTGRPKGTELTHRGLANFVQQSTVQYGFGSDERVLQFASISFDAAVEEIYLTLCSGGMLVLRTDEMIASTRTFCQLSAEQQLTVWDLPTAFWQRLTQDVEQGLAELPESLRIVIIGGEKVQPQIVQQWQQIVQGRNVRLLNTYGPTEATVVATFYEVTSDWQYVPGVDVPIGRPLGNVESYILDAHMQLVPLGVAGELYLGGPGLAAGYLNRPELTAERFVAHPFMAGERLYRTGDLAKMSADGNLHYLGRADDQVKIRGFRVELGEVEALVQQLDTVRECAVVVHPNEQGVVRLIAYVVTDKDEIVSQTLRQALLAKAPDYLVPALFMPIAEIPLTPAGKLNRKALPLPQKSDWTVEQAYVAPRTLTETGLAAIAAEVLGLDRVGVTDNFFALGGHSLAAMQILARIRTQTGKELSLRTLFSEPTVEALAREIEGKPVESASEETASDLAVKIPQCDRTQPIPLSSAQQRLWFLDRFEGASATYNLPFALRLTGELDVAALKQCLNEIVERHEALRTRFADVAGQGVQLVQPPFSLEISVEAIANEEVLTHRLQAEAQTPFDLETEPLLRVKLLQVEPTQHVLLLTLHHIIADGWSMGLIVREVMALYKEGDHAALPELPIQYADYAVWQQRQQQSEDYQDRLENWVSQLADAPALLKLPTDLPRPAVQTFNGGIVRRTTSAQLSQQLQRFSQRHGTTLFTTLMSAFATLMYRYSQQSDLVIATPIAGREHPDLENLVGFFVNTLPLRIQLSEGESFETLLNYVQTVSLDAFDNQDVPFAQLIESLPLERDPSYLPLCQVMFALQNAPQAKFELPDLTLESLSTHAGIAQYDLTLSASIEEDGLICNWEYNSDLFAVETVERVAANFEHLLEQIVQNASDSVNRLSLLEKDQQQQLLSLAERPDRVNEPLRPVHEWFEAQVEQSPDAVALVGRKNSETENSDIESWSYRQLNERANQIARHLQVAGIGANQIVAVCVERSNHQIAALLAVLKLGAAYLPMDPSYPSERLRLMLEEAQATALITRKHIQTRHGLQASNTIDIADERIAAYPTTNLGQTVGLDERAYIIFTSGSTGKPKGTELTHRGLANFVQQSRVQYGFGSDERVLQFASISFDAAVEEIYLTLCSGGTLLLRDDEMIASSEAFCRVSAEQQLTVWDLPTAFWHRLTKDIAQGLATLPDSLRTVIIGGEKVQAQIVQQWQQIARGRNVRLLNTYGPTEATVVATFYEVSASWQYLPGADVPIGRPLGNIETYILDQHLQLAPLGVAGELYLGGPCLAAGYLNQPELSAERFIAHPFKPGSRLYRTGDLVRMTADGELHYMGRADNQVKIRGFRVELGEIESAIAQLAAIREVTVICREDTPGKQTLCAYVVAPLEESIDAIALKKELRKELRQRLPEYMVPTYIVQMDALPLTGNNKVDRKALPVPQSEDLVTESRYQAPRNPTETELVAIWESLLEVSPIGIEDSFFELGGHSLLAMQLVSQIQQHFQVQLPLAALFQSPSASAIAALITDAQTNESPVTLAEIPVADRTQPLPVTIAQQRIWLLEQMEDMDGAYNMPICLQVQGEFKADVLNQCIAFMMERHESLRTTFRMIDEQPVQIVHESLPAQVEYEILEGSADIESVIAQYIGQPFDLVEGPLLRAKLIQRAPQQQILLVVIHHIIADGWSLGILTQEIASIYPALAQGQMPQLPKLPIQVADFAQWQRQLLQGEYLKAQLDYWQQQLGDAPARLDLPTDRPRPATQTFRGSTVSQSLPVQLSQQISRFSQQAGVSLYMTLLAAFGVLLHRYSGQAEVLIGSPIANRNHPQVQGLIGLFLNTLVLRLDCSDNPQFSDFLEQVKAVSLGAYAHQDAPFEQLIEILPSDRQQNTSPWFQVMFILQNNKEPDLLLPDIKVSPLELDGSVAKFELTLSVEETEEGLVGDWEYNSDLFNRETIEQMATNFEQLLSELMKNAQRTIDQAALLSTDEQQQLRFLGVQRGTGSEPLRPVHEWFEQQVAASPDAAALTASSNTWSYAQLNQRANQIARHLQSVGVSENHLVALCLERSPELIAALLAVLKVGAAYLPMDPTYPAERLHQMVEDAQVAALVTKEAIQSQLSFDVAQVVDIDDAAIQTQSVENLDLTISLEQRAYVIFTSGSTGRPKGTELTHRGLANFVQQSTVQYGFGSDERVLQFASISFDAAVEEIYLTLCSGGALILRDDEMIVSSETFCRVSAEQQLTVWDLPTAFWHRLTQDIEQGLAELPDSLRIVIIGGEKVQPQIVQQWRQIVQGRNVRLLNTYGPTEATVVAAFYEVDSDWQYVPGVDVPIGRPLGNVEGYILDAHMQLAPLGVAGELYLGGPGLAAGYLNRPELTAERFVAHPFKPGDRLYRTGDLAKMSADGNLHYLGRADDQVKIRGFRVELGEVEALVQQLDAVRECAVTTQTDNQGSIQLIAYVVTEGAELTSQALRQKLLEDVPNYLVPALFMPVEAIPLTPAGKLNRKALPQPQPSDWVATSEYVAPRSATEAALTFIVAEVLGLERVGVTDDFFALGGNSLAAMQVLARIRSMFGKEVGLRSLFSQPTIAALAEALEQAQEADDDDETEIPKCDRTQPIPLSLTQERFWFLAQLEGPSATYNLPIALRLNGQLNVNALAQCFAHVVERHEILRTRYIQSETGAVQVIQPAETVPLSQIDLSAMSQEAQVEAVEQHSRQAAQYPFDLSSEPLLQVTLLRLGDRQHILLMTMHHIVSDAWSMGVLVQEVMAAYPAYCKGIAPSMEPLPVQYADYSVWQQQQAATADFEARLDAWAQQLADAPPLLDLPTDRPRPAMQTFRGGMVEMTLPDELARSLKRFGQQQQKTLFMTLMGAFVTLMHRYSRQSDMAIGTPIAGRSHANLETLIGCFINTLPLRFHIDEAVTFSDLLSQVEAQSLSAFSNQDIPFEKLVEQLSLDRDLSYLPLCQVMFVLQNAPLEDLEIADLDWEMLDSHSKTARFDLTLSMQEVGDTLTGEWEYNSDLFDRETIERLAAQFERLLAAAVTQAKAPIAQLPILTAAEQQFFAAINQTQVDLPVRCIHHWFEDQAERTPAATALSGTNLHGQEVSLTYAQLNQRANQIAHYLQAKGVVPEQLVGICLNRCIDVVIAMLAVWKSGGAFVPFDPTYPVERLAYMANDAQIAVLIESTATAERFADLSSSVQRVCLEQVETELVQQPVANPQSDVSPANLGYVIYTSGSTGQPKGVLVEHTGIGNLAFAQISAFQITPESCVLQMASFSFDASISEVMMALCAGAELRIGNYERLMGQGAVLRQQGVSHLTIPPSALSVLAEEDLASVGHIIVAGEACPADLVAKWSNRDGFYDAYGPTETTVCATLANCTNMQEKPPIGRPIQNVQIYVVDQHLQLVPKGVPGELLIGGIGLARGYLNQPEKTAKAFIDNPFRSLADKAPAANSRTAKLYRTGDLVRFRSDGQLDYLGRIDHQVKLRGQRLELAEITSLLRTHPDVEEATVLLQPTESGSELLTAYVVTRSPNASDPSFAQAFTKTLQDFAAEHLPKYMVPTAFVLLEKMPLTPNGKIDRRALPTPQPQIRQASDYVAPRNLIEVGLAQMWSELLGVEQVGMTDSFFDLGGHSLLALQVLSRIQKQFGVNVDLQPLFEKPTIEQLSEMILAEQISRLDEDALVQLLEEIEGLSEENAQALLASEIP